VTTHDDEPLIARDATYYRAPDAVRAGVRASLAEAAREARGPAVRRGFAFGLSFAAVAAVSWTLALQFARPSAEDVLARDLVTAHVRSLMADHLDDVASSDRHTVKPWFTGKLDFAPPVHDLAQSGFPLTGGRLDYVDGHAVAALTYRYRLHVVNVFIWPAASGAEAPPRAQSRQGYSVMCWTHRGMRSCAVSDAEAAVLEALAEGLERAEGG